MLQIIHMTATYSNAMLVAVLPYVSECAKQLDLPITQPITAAQVAHFSPNPYKDRVVGAVWLTNRYWFIFSNGFVRGFRSPDNWFAQQDIDNLGRFVGKDNMTTNGAIQLARDSFRKLGYKPEDFHVDGLPTEVHGPYDNVRLGRIPFCEVEWNSPEATSQKEFDQGYNIKFDIDLQRKRVVGMTLMSKRFFQPEPKVGVVPELESDYRKRSQGRMFVRTNAPAHWPASARAPQPALPSPTNSAAGSTNRPDAP